MTTIRNTGANGQTSQRPGAVGITPSRAAGEAALPSAPSAPAQSNALAERKAEEDKRRIERAAADAIARKEAEARKAAEDEVRRLNALEAAKAKAAAAVARKAASAPDREKLTMLATYIGTAPLPDMGSEDGKIALMQVTERILALATWIEEEANLL